MEVSVVTSDNVPEGCLLSISAGGSRRQAPLLPRQKFAFSGQSAAAAVASGGSGLKVDVLSVQGSSRIRAEDLASTFMPEEGTGGSASAAPGPKMFQVDIKPSEKGHNKKGKHVEDTERSESESGQTSTGSMSVSLNIRATHLGSETARGGNQASSMASARAGASGGGAEEQEALSMAASVVPPNPSITEQQEENKKRKKEKKNIQQDADGVTPPRSSRRHHAALEARSYLEDHNILPFVERMLRTLVQERPSDPWHHIRDMLPMVETPPTPTKPKDIQKLMEAEDLPGPALDITPQLGIWKCRPSVGTWFMPKRPVGNPVIIMATATLPMPSADADAVITFSAVVQDDLAVAPTTPCLPPWPCFPSIGTWMILRGLHHRAHIVDAVVETPGPIVEEVVAEKSEEAAAAPPAFEAAAAGSLGTAVADAIEPLEARPSPADMRSVPPAFLSELYTRFPAKEVEPAAPEAPAAPPAPAVKKEAKAAPPPVDEKSAVKEEAIVEESLAAPPLEERPAVKEEIVLEEAKAAPPPVEEKAVVVEEEKAAPLVEEKPMVKEETVLEQSCAAPPPLEEQPAVKEEIVLEEASPEPAEVEEQESMELFFGVSYYEIDHKDFKAGVKDGLKDLGCSEQNLDKVTVGLRPGSTVAIISGPTSALGAVKACPLDSLSVMGYKAFTSSDNLVAYETAEKDKVELEAKDAVVSAATSVVMDDLAAAVVHPMKVAEKMATAAKVPWQLRPSVGTWCNKRLFASIYLKVAEVQEAAESETAAKAAPVQPAAPEAPAPLAPSMEKEVVRVEAEVKAAPAPAVVASPAAEQVSDCPSTVNQLSSCPSQIVDDMADSYAARTIQAAQDGAANASDAASEVGPPSGAEKLREQAKATLLEASANGSLDTALSNLRKRSNGPEEKLREQAKATLLAASANGALDTALSNLRKKNDDPEEKLRQQAKATLLAASANGALDTALSDLRKKSNGPEEKLREQAKATLLEASANGSLDTALTNAKKKSDGPEEKLREQAKATLLEASANGALATALSNARKKNNDTEEKLREQAKATLLAASANGALDTALSNLRKKNNDPEEKLRQQAKAALLAASANGALDTALSDLRKKSNDPEVAAPKEEPEPVPVWTGDKSGDFRAVPPNHWTNLHSNFTSEKAAPEVSCPVEKVAPEAATTPEKAEPEARPPTQERVVAAYLLTACIPKLILKDVSPSQATTPMMSATGPSAVCTSRGTGRGTAVADPIDILDPLAFRSQGNSASASEVKASQGSEPLGEAEADSLGVLSPHGEVKALQDSEPSVEAEAESLGMASGKSSVPKIELEPPEDSKASNASATLVSQPTISVTDDATNAAFAQTALQAEEKTAASTPCGSQASSLGEKPVLTAQQIAVMQIKNSPSNKSNTASQVSQPSSVTGLDEAGKQVVMEAMQSAAKEEPMPSTELTEPVPAGSKILPVGGAAGFAVGDPIFIESLAGSEANAIEGFSSIKIMYPLQFSHPPGTKISKLPADDDRVKSLPADFRERAEGSRASSQSHITATAVSVAASDAAADEVIAMTIRGAEESLLADAPLAVATGPEPEEPVPKEEPQASSTTSAAPPAVEERLLPQAASKKPELEKATVETQKSAPPQAAPPAVEDRPLPPVAAKEPELEEAPVETQKSAPPQAAPPAVEERPLPPVPAKEPELEEAPAETQKSAPPQAFRGVELEKAVPLPAAEDQLEAPASGRTSAMQTLVSDQVETPELDIPTVAKNAEYAESMGPSCASSLVGVNLVEPGVAPVEVAGSGSQDTRSMGSSKPSTIVDGNFFTDKIAGAAASAMKAVETETRQEAERKALQAKQEAAPAEAVPAEAAPAEAVPEEVGPEEAKVVKAAALEEVKATPAEAQAAPEEAFPKEATDVQAVAVAVPEEAKEVQATPEEAQAAPATREEATEVQVADVIAPEEVKEAQATPEEAKPVQAVVEEAEAAPAEAQAAPATPEEIVPKEASEVQIAVLAAPEEAKVAPEEEKVLAKPPAAVARSATISEGIEKVSSCPSQALDDIADNVVDHTLKAAQERAADASDAASQVSQAPSSRPDEVATQMSCKLVEGSIAHATDDISHCDNVSRMTQVTPAQGLGTAVADAIDIASLEQAAPKLVAVHVNFRFENLDYDKVMSTGKLADDVKSKTGEAIAHCAKVSPTSVDVQLSPGSVIVNAQIYCMSAGDAELINKQIAADGGSLMQSVDKFVSQIPDINSALAPGCAGLGVGGLKTSDKAIADEAAPAAPPARVPKVALDQSRDVSKQAKPPLAPANISTSNLRPWSPEAGNEGPRSVRSVVTTPSSERSCMASRVIAGTISQVEADLNSEVNVGRFSAASTDPVMAVPPMAAEAPTPEDQGSAVSESVVPPSFASAVVKNAITEVEVDLSCSDAPVDRQSVFEEPGASSSKEKLDPPKPSRSHSESIISSEVAPGISSLMVQNTLCQVEIDISTTSDADVDRATAASTPFSKPATAEPMEMERAGSAGTAVADAVDLAEATSVEKSFEKSFEKSTVLPAEATLQDLTDVQSCASSQCPPSFASGVVKNVVAEVEGDIANSDVVVDRISDFEVEELQQVPFLAPAKAESSIVSSGVRSALATNVVEDVVKTVDKDVSVSEAQVDRDPSTLVEEEQLPRSKEQPPPRPQEEPLPRSQEEPLPKSLQEPLPPPPRSRGAASEGSLGSTSDKPDAVTTAMVENVFAQAEADLGCGSGVQVDRSSGGSRPISAEPRLLVPGLDLNKAQPAESAVSSGDLLRNALVSGVLASNTSQVLLDITPRSSSLIIDRESQVLSLADQPQVVSYEAEARAPPMDVKSAPLADAGETDEAVVATVDFTFDNLDYGKVTTNPDFCGPLKHQLREGIAAFTKIPVASVAVDFSAGSLVVSARIYCDQQSFADRIKSGLDSDMDSFMAAMEARAKQVPDIATATTDGNPVGARMLGTGTKREQVTKGRMATASTAAPEPNDVGVEMFMNDALPKCLQEQNQMSCIGTSPMPTARSSVQTARGEIPQIRFAEPVFSAPTTEVMSLGTDDYGSTAQLTQLPAPADTADEASKVADTILDTPPKDDLSEVQEAASEAPLPGPLDVPASPRSEATAAMQTVVSDDVAMDVPTPSDVYPASKSGNTSLMQSRASSVVAGVLETSVDHVANMAMAALESGKEVEGVALDSAALQHAQMVAEPQTTVTSPTASQASEEPGAASVAAVVETTANSAIQARDPPALPAGGKAVADAIEMDTKSAPPPDAGETDEETRESAPERQSVASCVPTVASCVPATIPEEAVVVPTSARTSEMNTLVSAEATLQDVSAAKLASGATSPMQSRASSMAGGQSSVVKATVSQAAAGAIAALEEESVRKADELQELKKRQSEERKAEQVAKELAEQDAAKKAAELAALQEAQEIARKADEEKRKQVEIAAQKAKEEAEEQAREARRAEEAARLAEEVAAKEAADRAAEEARKAAVLRAEAEKKAEEVKKAEELVAQKQKEEIERKAEEAKQAALAEEARKAEELAALQAKEEASKQTEKLAALHAQKEEARKVEELAAVQAKEDADRRLEEAMKAATDLSGDFREIPPPAWESLHTGFEALQPVKAAPVEEAPSQLVRAAPVEEAPSPPVKAAPVEAAPSQSLKAAPVEAAPAEEVRPQTPPDFRSMPTTAWTSLHKNFPRAESPPDVNKIFDTMDTNKDGFIDRAEFNQAMSTGVLSTGPALAELQAEAAPEPAPEETPAPAAGVSVADAIDVDQAPAKDVAVFSTADMFFKFDNLDYDVLLDDKNAFTSMTRELKETISTFAEAPLTSVDVDLSKGSVAVNASIFCPNPEVAKEITSKVESNSASLTSSLETAAMRVPNIMAMIGGAGGLGLSALKAVIGEIKMPDGYEGSRLATASTAFPADSTLGLSAASWPSAFSGVTKDRWLGRDTMENFSTPEHEESSEELPRDVSILTEASEKTIYPGDTATPPSISEAEEAPPPPMTEEKPEVEEMEVPADKALPVVEEKPEEATAEGSLGTAVYDAIEPSSEPAPVEVNRQAAPDFREVHPECWTKLYSGFEKSQQAVVDASLGDKVAEARAQEQDAAVASLVKATAEDANLAEKVAEARAQEQDAAVASLVKATAEDANLAEKVAEARAQECDAEAAPPAVEEMPLPPVTAKKPELDETPAETQKSAPPQAFRGAEVEKSVPLPAAEEFVEVPPKAPELPWNLRPSVGTWSNRRLFAAIYALVAEAQEAADAKAAAKEAAAEPAVVDAEREAKQGEAEADASTAAAVTAAAVTAAAVTAVTAAAMTEDTTAPQHLATPKADTNLGDSADTTMVLESPVADNATSTAVESSLESPGGGAPSTALEESSSFTDRLPGATLGSATNKQAKDRWERPASAREGWITHEPLDVRQEKGQSTWNLRPSIASWMAYPVRRITPSGPAAELSSPLATSSTAVPASDKEQTVPESTATTLYPGQMADTDATVVPIDTTKLDTVTLSPQEVADQQDPEKGWERADAQPVLTNPPLEVQGPIDGEWALRSPTGVFLSSGILDATKDSGLVLKGTPWKLLPSSGTWNSKLLKRDRRGPQAPVPEPLREEEINEILAQAHLPPKLKALSEQAAAILQECDQVALGNGNLKAENDLLKAELSRLMDLASPGDSPFDSVPGSPAKDKKPETAL